MTITHQQFSLKGGTVKYSYPFRAFGVPTLLALGCLLPLSAAHAVPSSFNVTSQIFGLRVIREADQANVTWSGPSMGGGTYRLELDSGAYMRMGNGQQRAITHVSQFFQVYDARLPNLYQDTSLNWDVSRMRVDRGDARGFSANPVRSSYLIHPIADTNSLGNFTFGNSVLRKGSIYWGFQLGYRSAGLSDVEENYFYLGRGVQAVPEAATWAGFGGFLLLGSLTMLRSRRARAKTLSSDEA
jgi:hypothetical protein